MPSYSRIAATGHYVPPTTVRNEDLLQFPANSLALIESKTGVRARRHAASTECTSDLGFYAATACLARAGIPATDLDAIVLATSSPDRIQPATATRVQQALGATHAFAFDVNSVCTGAVYGIAIADAMVRTGQCRTAMVIAAEVYSKYLNRTDFTTYPYFGDGAGAVLLTASNGQPGIVETLLRSDGSGADVIQIPGGGTMLPYGAMTQEKDAFFRMRGREVYDFAVTRGAEIIGELLRQTSLTPADVAWVVPHQANINVIREISQRSGIPFERFIVNLDRYGNTAAASVLIGLDELMAGGQARAGDHVIVVAFGGGLSWGAALLRVT